MSSTERTIHNRYYDLEYYCLTDDNIILVKRNNEVIQIKPSEFKLGDLLPSYSNGSVVWEEAVVTKHIVKAGSDLIRLEAQRGTFYLTPGHKLFLDDLSLQAAGNLTTDDILKFVDNNDILPTNNDINPAASYALGAYSAEGSHQAGLGRYGTGKWRLVWGLNYNEEIFATKILVGILALCPYSNPFIDEFKELSRRTVSIYCKESVLFFDKIGVLGYSNEKRVPPCILNASLEAKAAYIAGILEGDATWNGQGIALGLTSKALVDGVHYLLSSLGIKSTITFSPKSENLDKNEKDLYTLFIHGKVNLLKLVDKLKRWWYGWKHLNKILEYSTSPYKYIKYSIAHVDEYLQELWPINFKDFQKQACIGQSTIERLFGSWNNCLRYFNLPLKRTRWSSDYVADPSYLKKLRPRINNHNGINKVVIYNLTYDIIVYDFSVPSTENFLLNTIVSHNSSSQASCYIGDIWVDDISSISYQRMQQKTPLYGYASQLFDDTAYGQVIVQGAFSINYKEQGYLWAVLKRWFGQNLEDSFASKNPKNTAKKANALFQNNRYGTKESIGGKPVIGSNGTRVSRTTIERLKQGKLTRQERFDFNHTLAGWATFSPGSGKDKTFEDIVEVFEDQLWTQDDQKTLQQTRRTDDNVFDGFDIYMLFGNYANKYANHTAIKILGCRIIGESMQVNADGQPIQQNFEFIARTTI